MKEKINIAELLKDCPQGMELDCAMFVNPVTFSKVSIECKYPITIKTKKGDIIKLTEYGQYEYAEDAKCIIFPKGKNTWEGFHRPFVNGDVIVDKTGAIAIYKQIHNSYAPSFIIDFHCRITSKNNGFFHINGIGSLSHCWEIDSARFATEEEKEKLFAAIKENGYRWNAETKTLEKLSEPKFKDGDIISDSIGTCIFKKEGMKKGTVDFYCVFYDDTFHVKNTPEGHCGNIDDYRLSTEEEKQKLFDAIKKNGYKWNEETKSLEKIQKYSVEYIMANLKAELNRYGDDIVTVKISLGDTVVYFKKVSLNEISFDLNID